MCIRSIFIPLCAVRIVYNPGKPDLCIYTFGLFCWSSVLHILVYITAVSILHLCLFSFVVLSCYIYACVRTQSEMEPHSLHVHAYSTTQADSDSEIYFQTLPLYK